MSLKAIINKIDSGGTVTKDEIRSLNVRDRKTLEEYVSKLANEGATYSKDDNQWFPGENYDKWSDLLYDINDKKLGKIIPAQTKKNSQFVSSTDDGFKLFYKDKSFDLVSQGNELWIKSSTGQMIDPTNKNDLKKIGAANIDYGKLKADYFDEKHKVDLSNQAYLERTGETLSPAQEFQFDSPLTEFFRATEEADNTVAGLNEKADKKTKLVNRLQNGKFNAKEKNANKVDLTASEFLSNKYKIDLDQFTNYVTAKLTEAEPGTGTKSDAAETKQPDAEFAQKNFDEAAAALREGVNPIAAAISWMANNKGLTTAISGGLATVGAFLLYGGKEDPKVVEDPDYKAQGDNPRPAIDLIDHDRLNAEAAGKQAALIKSLELAAAGSPVDAREVYYNMEEEYNRNFHMSKADAIELRENTRSKIMEDASSMYENAVTTFFDRIYQGLGRSSGQTSAELLKNNQKLRSDMGKLMEGSALLAKSLVYGPKNPQAFKMRAIASHQIMEVVDPGTWDKIADNAVRAAAGIQSVMLHNSQIVAERAKIMYGQKIREIEGATGKKLDDMSPKDIYGMMKDLIVAEMSAESKGKPVNMQQSQALQTELRSRLPGKFVQ